MREASLERIQPGRHAGFAGVYLLTTTNEANDYGPFKVAIHDANEELWLGHGEVDYAVLAFHKSRSLLEIPSPLGFVEDGDSFDRWQAAQVAAYNC